MADVVKRGALPAEDDAHALLRQGFDDCGVPIFCPVIGRAVNLCICYIERGFAVNDDGEFYIFLARPPPYACLKTAQAY